MSLSSSTTNSRRCRSGSPRSSGSGSSTIAWSFTESRSIATARRPNWRAVTRVGAALALFAIIAPIHILTKVSLGRSPWPPRFLAGVSRIFGARARLDGDRPGPHTLLVANHISWFDIVVLGGATRCTFVAKDELGHPFIHWLADQNHTV